MKNRNIFKNPPKKYNPKKIVHAWKDDLEAEAENIIAQGYGGVVTNVPFEDGFTSSKANHVRFAEIMSVLEKKALPFWIYDESGYPSGKAGGLTLEDHPEFEAKGFFMYKRPAFEKTKAKYHLPDEADKIIYAAKYKFGDRNTRETVDYSTAMPIPFGKDYLECELNAGEMLYVFSVKTVFEGSHGMNNVSTALKNINILDEKAVRRFIDVAYEPIAKENPTAFERSEKVFTDEPSLFVSYTDEKDTWTYACAPYVDGIFEEYKKEYGEDLQPYLPLIFEGGTSCYQIRVKFYELVGKLVAKAYSGQIRDWCREHGSVFSGHYLGEDNIGHHVAYYGNYIKVLMNTGYPGIDILDCFPEIFQFINQKVPQMAARKMGADGMMVELCPFVMKEKFDEAPYDNMKCITALCYMHGVRTANSYFQNSDIDEMKDFNDYVGRIGYMLEGLREECSIFVYYPIEDAQAKLRPRHSSRWIGEETSTQDALRKTVDALEFGGFDFLFADHEDIISAANSPKNLISGLEAKTIIVPGINIIRGSTLKALKKLASKGVTVKFVDVLPSFDAENGCEIICDFSAHSVENILNGLYENGGTFVQKNKNKIIRSRFSDDDKTVYMLVNMDREDGEIIFNSQSDGEVWLPDDGSTKFLKAGEKITVPALRAIFVII